ncbi:uncharacterized protein LOC130674920 isoform X1 [Microplitis mediator]|uniref:uncharacterized protein LOC130674920 isoform X1 n=1 Tax=Microplitis mediator TaxID=375433 RepID=UPI002552D32E|nr:uncharacterized protein LOC130674920 isoform X1 [Microplitis mediator]
MIPAHMQPVTFHHLHNVTTGYTSAMGFNFTYLYEISRFVKSWNICFPSRNRTSSFDARKYIKTIEQRMRSYDIPFKNFPTVVTNTLNGNVLEWYYQNEKLFIYWETFKYYFKTWQTQQIDEDLLQEIYAAKQGNDETGVSFVNRMQGAFMQLEEPLPQAKQIRIIIARSNSCFLQKFAGENISNYAELFIRVSAWQATANALNSHYNVSNKQKARIPVDHCIQDSPDFYSINCITTAQPHASQNKKPSSNKNNYCNCHRNSSRSDNKANDSNLELPALLNNFESFMKSFLERLERITSSNSSANTIPAQPTSVKNTPVCGRCGRIGHVSDLCCAPTTDKLRIKAGLKVRQKSAKNFENQANIKYTDKTDGEARNTRVEELIHFASPIDKVQSNSEILDPRQVTRINKSNNNKTPKIKTKHQKARTATDKIETTQSVAPKLYSQSSTHSVVFCDDTVKPSGKFSSASLKAPLRVSQMVTNVYIGQHKIDALLDSGSGRSYISEAAYEHIKENQLQELISGPMNAREVIMANSKPTQTRGGAPFRINLDGHDIITWLTVVPGLSTPVILGLDFWQLADIQVNSKENTWKINSSEITHTFSSRTRQFNSASLNSLSSTEEANHNRNLLLKQQGNITYYNLSELIH